MRDFDWDAEDGMIVVPRQEALAAYYNPDGDVVIRQQGGGLGQEDAYVVINRRYIAALIERLRTLETAAKDE